MKMLVNIKFWADISYVLSVCGLTGECLDFVRYLVLLLCLISQILLTYMSVKAVEDLYDLIFE